MSDSEGTVSSRFRMALNREEGMKSLSKIILQHGFVEGEPFSFKDHEFQIDIVDDTAQRIDVRKCSQVGLTEMMAQKVLAIMAVQRNIRIMFSQPTKEMATKFSKDRIDGAIEQSAFYSKLVKAGSDAAGMKKLGQNLLYIMGTYGANSAISVPAEMIISDEIDFSNDGVLGKLNSRIRHAKTVDAHGNRGYRYRFSTPTVDGFGIDVGFNAGDQRYYMCKCEHCSTWVCPEFASDLVLPGWDKPLMEFSRDNLDDERIDISGAWIKCPNCAKNLWASLCDKDRRQWVAKKPSNFDHSYQVYPWDVPFYNTPSGIIRQFEGYPIKADFYNFVVGLPYSDAENSFITTDEHRKKYCDIDLWIFNAVIRDATTVGGMDIGKTCHLTVKVKVSGGWHVVWMEKISNTKLDPATPKVVARFDYYRMRKLCIDAGPDITLVNSLVAARGNGRIQAVVYTTVPGFIPIHLKPDGDTINADRTKTLSLLLSQHNNGENHYPHREDLRIELYKHLGTTKKIRERNTLGDIVEKFIKTDKQDHWVHSLNYCNIAAMALVTFEDDSVVGSMPGTSAVKLGSAVEEKKQIDVGSQLAGMFGFKRPR
ncbi:terminase large subunit [Pseudomonas phage PMBT3]|uniref:Terminase large subunit n=1 Tax=Pseudomonas phage PMBT3 TaxID=2059856 RepID=A0A2I6PHS9_9CAUD|nr:terminase large subunit [Pseudomonas phage PMBT3]AUM59603.1 terminase large subunit [Pseudomonas phage PMBT3]